MRANGPPPMATTTHRSSAATQDRRGFVLTTVVFAIAIMSVVVVAALASSSDEGRASRAVRESTLATYAAEAGLRSVYGSWPSVAVQSLAPGDSLDLGWQNLPNKASYRTVIHRVDGGGLQEYVVAVQGRRAGLNGGVSTVIGAVGGVPVFAHAIFAQTNIALNGGGIVDAYDSDAGDYNPAVSDTIANLRSNGSIDIQKMTVYGDASAVTSVNVGTQVDIRGATTSSAVAAAAMDIPACPVGGYTPAAQVPGGAGITYNPLSGVLNVAAGAVLTLNSGDYYFSQVVLSGNSTLRVKPDAGERVEIVISDLLNVVGGTVSNLSDRPSGLGFASCGTPVTPSTWTLNGGAGSAFSIYAPNHSISVGGSGDIWGAIVGSTYTATGGAKLHYDAALARQPSKGLIVHPASWAQLAGS